MEELEKEVKLLHLSQDEDIATARREVNRKLEGLYQIRLENACQIFRCQRGDGARGPQVLRGWLSHLSKGTDLPFKL